VGSSSFVVADCHAVVKPELLAVHIVMLLSNQYRGVSLPIVTA
jgi:hypothetical protein